MTRISRITTPRATALGFLLLALAMLGFAAAAGPSHEMDAHPPVAASTGDAPAQHPCTTNRRAR